jgi:hypothetical protein
VLWGTNTLILQTFLQKSLALSTDAVAPLVVAKKGIVNGHLGIKSGDPGATNVDGRTA